MQCDLTLVFLQHIPKNHRQSKPVISKLTIQEATGPFTVTGSPQNPNILVEAEAKFRASKTNVTVSNLQNLPIA